LLLLVALAALALYSSNTQDATRFGLAESVVLDGSLRIDRWQEQTGGDYAFRAGHYYTDKAPGVSMMAVPPFALLRASGAVGDGLARQGIWHEDSLAWSLRILTVGALFVLGAFLVGRVAEGLVEATGGAAAATFGLGTLALPLASTTFSHVAAGALAFAGFLLAWAALERRRSALLAAGGFCAGLAVFFEYPLALAALIVTVYVAVRSRRPGAVALFLGGIAPSVAGLAAYNAAAFGSPLRFSYSYVPAEEQRQGLFGIGTPGGRSLVRILFSEHGLVTETPVLVIAAAGLVLLWRAGRRAEATVCGATTIAFLLYNAGYYLPFGGASPGPRFFVPALPFLALGLPHAFRRLPVLTSALALLSIALMTFDSATSGVSLLHPGLGGFEPTIWSVAGLPRALGAALVFAAALGATVLAARRLRPLVTFPFPGS